MAILFNYILFNFSSNGKKYKWLKLKVSADDKESVTQMIAFVSER